MVSDILLAALPVGAQSTTFFPSCLYNSNIVLIIVVLPVPGPPVMTQTLLSLIALTASNCFSDSSISECFSNVFIFLSNPFIFFIFLPSFKFINLLAIFFSAL